MKRLTLLLLLLAAGCTYKPHSWRDYYPEIAAELDAREALPPVGPPRGDLLSVPGLTYPETDYMAEHDRAETNRQLRRLNNELELQRKLRSMPGYYD